MENYKIELKKSSKIEMDELKDKLESEKLKTELLKKEVYFFSLKFIKKLENSESLLSQYKVENEGKSKIIEERNLEIKTVREKLQNYTKS